MAYFLFKLDFEQAKEFISEKRSIDQIESLIVKLNLGLLDKQNAYYEI